MEERPYFQQNPQNIPDENAASATVDGADLLVGSLSGLAIGNSSIQDSLSQLKTTIVSQNGGSSYVTSPITSQPLKPRSRRASGALSNDKTPVSPRPTRRSSGISNNFNDAPISPGRPQFGRASSHNPVRPTSMGSASALPLPEEPVPPTAASIAAAYLKKDLSRHTTLDTAANAPQTIAIIHDSCYGHRYSRPKTSKGVLSNIVERPERIQAGIMGLSSAYTLLGQRHAGGHSPPTPDADPVGSIPFCIRKTTRAVPLTSSAVTNVHGTKWMTELKTMCEAAEMKLASGGKELTRPEETGFGPQAAKPKLHEGDLYLCKESLDALQGALGGVLDGVDAVFENSTLLNGPKRAFICIRPPGHHCSSDYPSGFCWLNNVHVGIEHAVQTYGLTHAAIIDFDLHHGDGSQSITWERNARPWKATKAIPHPKRAAIGYFSLHDINSYPCEEGDTEKVQSASLCMENAHGQSIWNVHLQPWKTEEDFWKLYNERYLVLLEKTRAFLYHHTWKLLGNPAGPRPVGAIFLSAGFDASEWEGQGMQRHKVNVPTTFYARFTADIVRLAEEAGTGVHGRVISVLEGGYSDRALTSGVLSHMTGLVNFKVLEDSKDQNDGQGNGAMENEDRSQHYTGWWSEVKLKELEELQTPVLADVPKKPQYTGPPTYASNTQSFTAKIIDPSKIHRSTSGSVQAITDAPSEPEKRYADVDWATAAHAISKLLIPTDRQINSWRHDELSEPRVKKEKQSTLAAAQDIKTTRPNRGKKAVLANHVESNLESAAALPLRSVSQDIRRQTMPPGAFSIEDRAFMQSTGQSQRRSSTASTTHSVNGEPAEAAPAADFANTPTKEPSALNIRKSRRQSGFKPEMTKASTPSKPPPVPKLPYQSSKVQKAAPSIPSTSIDASMPAVNGDAATKVEAMTNGFKKLVLKMPDGFTADTAAKAAAKASKNAAATRMKPAAVRKPGARSTKKTPVQTPIKNESDEPLPSLHVGASTEKITEPIVVSPTVQANIEPVGPKLPHETCIEKTPADTSDNLSNPLMEPIYPISPEQVDMPITTGFTPLNAPVASSTENFPAQPAPAMSSSPSVVPTPPHRTDSAATYHTTFSTQSRQTSATPQTPPALSPVHTTHTFVPYEPPRQSSTASTMSRGQPSEPLTWLPPNTATPAALRRGPGPSAAMGTGKEATVLPVWTSDGVIPFATPPVGASGTGVGLGSTPAVKGAEGSVEMDIDSDLGREERAGRAEDVWAVPGTPGM